MRALRKMDHGCRRAGMTGDLPRGSFEVLLAVNLHVHCHGGEPLRIGLLGEQMGRPTPAISRWVGELEERGLLRRYAGDDRRTVCVELTDEGRALMERGRQRLLGSVSEMLESLGPDDAERLIGLMERAEDIFKGMNGEQL